MLAKVNKSKKLFLETSVRRRQYEKVLNDLMYVADSDYVNFWRKNLEYANAKYFGIKYDEMTAKLEQKAMELKKDDADNGEIDFDELNTAELMAERLENIRAKEKIRFNAIESGRRWKKSHDRQIAHFSIVYKGNLNDITYDRKMFWENTREYMAYRYHKDGKGKKAVYTVYDTMSILSDGENGIAKAYSVANNVWNDLDGNIRVYPIWNPNNGNLLYNFANYVAKSFEKWERNNDFAVVNVQKRNKDYRDEMAQTVAEKSLEYAKRHGITDTMTMCKVGFNILSAMQKNMRRKGKTELNQDEPLTGNVEPIVLHPNKPDLINLVYTAFEDESITTEQRLAIYDNLVNGLSIAKIAERDNVSRSMAQKRVEKAKRNLLKAMIKHDETGLLYWYDLSADAEKIIEKLDLRYGKKNKK